MREFSGYLLYIFLHTSYKIIGSYNVSYKQLQLNDKCTWDRIREHLNPLLSFDVGLVL